MSIYHIGACCDAQRQDLICCGAGKLPKMLSYSSESEERSLSASGCHVDVNWNQHGEQQCGGSVGPLGVTWRLEHRGLN